MCSTRVHESQVKVKNINSNIEKRGKYTEMYIYVQLAVICNKLVENKSQSCCPFIGNTTKGQYTHIQFGA